MCLWHEGAMGGKCKYIEICYHLLANVIGTLETHFKAPRRNWTEFHPWFCFGLFSSRGTTPTYSCLSIECLGSRCVIINFMTCSCCITMHNAVAIIEHTSRLSKGAKYITIVKKGIILPTSKTFWCSDETLAPPATLCTFNLLVREGG